MKEEQLQKLKLQKELENSMKKAEEEKQKRLEQLEKEKQLSLERKRKQKAEEIEYQKKLEDFQYIKERIIEILDECLNNKNVVNLRLQRLSNLCHNTSGGKKYGVDILKTLYLECNNENTKELITKYFNQFHSQ